MDTCIQLTVNVNLYGWGDTGDLRARSCLGRLLDAAYVEHIERGCFMRRPTF